MKTARVRFQTTEGNFVLELNGKKAPKTVENFLQYVREGHYNGTIFHRVMSNFMIQGGGFVSGMDEKPTREPIKNEANNGLSNECYTAAMARTGDPHSATAQFFINVRDNTFLDYKSATPQGWGYAVFGKVVEGTDTIDKIKTKPTTRVRFHEDVPREDITILKAEILGK
ncbi:MAG: peptidyl-prolyl cis-trans isomerase [Burkholderiales bacterium]|jgi:peptidyl-prolyl cis-trans isomerase B (cyclophilin B)|nr:peptidyl-prolyl cis-trans isomerase [Burkholderiales bacterium]